MSLSRSSKPKYPRNSPTRSSGKSFLIVTEGEKTEPLYFKQIRDKLRLRDLDVKIVHPPATDPVSLTKHALQLKKARFKESKKNLEVVPYDEIWVVFDLEKPNDQRRILAQQAKRLTGADGILFAESDPCFEYWLLLYWEYTTANFEDCDRVAERLKKHWSDCGKNQKLPPERLINYTPFAIKNAHFCRIYHQSHTATQLRNPSTDVDRLIVSLNASAQPFNQFVLSI